MKFIKIHSFLFLLFAVGIISAQDIDTISIHPEVFEHAINNPLKGFRPGLSTAKKESHPYSKVVREYIRWNELERNEDDGIERMIQVFNNKWKDVGDKNIKIIPRVYLDWDSKSGNEYWPSDMKTGDYSSYEFEQRVERLVRRLALIWDNDPRIAWIQMGIIGYWGEHHHPAPNDKQQKLLGDVFQEAFKNKKIIIRRPWETFEEYDFGWYWDSFAHINQISSQAGPMMHHCPERWKVAPIEGECAYNWGDYENQPGASPNVTLREASHRNWLISYIRQLHCTALGWVSGFDYNNAAVLAGAEEVQKAFGYRYILKEVKYPASISANEPFSVSFKVENTGSAPFYYDWPVELRLLDAESHETKWKQLFHDVDIRSWMPGDDYRDNLKAYKIQPEITNNNGSFQIDANLEKGKYILALTVLDPDGMVPNLRFATSQYFKGGLHPIGYIGVDTNVDQAGLEGMTFDNPAKDRSLYYSEERGEIIDTIPAEIIVKPVRKTIKGEHWEFPGDTVQAWQYDYYDDESGERTLELDSAQTFGIYGCDDVSGENIRNYTNSTARYGAAQYHWNQDAQTFQINGQWLEYSVLFKEKINYLLRIRARNNADANFKMTVFGSNGDTVFHSDLNLFEDLQNEGGGDKETDWYVYKFPIENLWGAYTVKFDWYNQIGEAGVFGGFSFMEYNLDLSPPEWNYVSIGTVSLGSEILAITNEDATVYLVPAGTASSIDEIKTNAITSGATQANQTLGFPSSEMAIGDYILYAIDAADNISEASRTITLQTGTDVKHKPAEFELQLFLDQEAKTIRIVSNMNIMKIAVYNLLGKRMNTINCEHNIPLIQMHNLKPGVYFLEARNHAGYSKTVRFSVH